MNAEEQLARAHRRLERAAGAKREEVARKLGQPEREVSVSVPVPREAGGVDYFKGFRIQYDTTRGPGKGGVRYHPSVTCEEVRLLGFLMAVKCALLELPFGGAKGGVQVDVHDLSDREVELLSRNLIRLLARDIGPYRDIPAPDAYTNPRIMGWMEDEYAKLQKEHVSAVVTGKPVARGGTAVRQTATAQGAFHVVKRASKVLSSVKRGATVAVQGFGNAGSNLARLLEDAGYTVVAASDSGGGVYHGEGISVEDLKKVKSKNGSVQSLYGEGSVRECVGCEELEDDDILELDVDILVPAALGGVITGENVDQIRADVIVEVANAAIEQDAQDRLVERGVTVLPDVLVNAGGVTASYFEWSNNLGGGGWSEDQQEELLEEFMTGAFERVAEQADRHGGDWRSAAYAVAAERIGEAIVMPGRMRGE